MKNTLIPLDMIFISRRSHDRRASSPTPSRSRSRRAAWTSRRSTCSRSAAASRRELGIRAGDARRVPRRRRPLSRREAKLARCCAMLATLADAPLRDPHLVYEPKYDGIRAIVIGDARRASGADASSIASRLGNDKTAQFPEIVARARGLGARGRPATASCSTARSSRSTPRAQPLGFGSSSRASTSRAARTSRAVAATQPVALVRLRSAARGRRGSLQAAARRAPQAARGDARAARGTSGSFASRARSRGDGEALMAEAQADGWEGLIAKDARSLYRPGGARPTGASSSSSSGRSSSWAAGRSRAARAHRFGALLLGLPTPDGQLRYVGHVGGGFSETRCGRRRASTRSRRRRARSSARRRPTTGRTGSRPALVAEVRFGDWTDDGHLRHPVFLGLRDDVAPHGDRARADARRAAELREDARDEPRGRASATQPPRRSAARRPRSSTTSRRRSRRSRRRGAAAAASRCPRATCSSSATSRRSSGPSSASRRASSCATTSTIAPQLLPVVRDRPLVMRRFPTGSRARPSTSTARPTTCRPACAPSPCRATPTSRRASSAARSRRCST